MSIVTAAEFKKYANKVDSDTTGEALYQMYIDAAEAVVSEYLGYNPASTAYTHEFLGWGDNYLQLKAMPITALTSVAIDGVSVPAGNFKTESEKLFYKNSIFPKGSTVAVAYTAGYAAVPAAIKNCILQIASLKAMEAGENIGVTSTSFDGGNSRSFFNHTDYKKFLSQVSLYRLVRL